MSDIVEEAFAEPAKVLEEGVEAAEKAKKELLSKRPFRIVQEYANTLGPGLITGAADDDPSGIATYSQTGARYGYGLLWLSVFTFPLMSVVQEMCARIGIVTGEGLAANIRKQFPAWVLYLCVALLAIANILNLGADLGAMAKGVQLLAPSLSFGMLVIAFAVVILLLQIFTTYARYAKYLKYLTFVLFAYVVAALSLHLNWMTVLHDMVVPHVTFTKDAFLLVCAILGTTISPYLFFWQTSQEVEEDILRGKTTIEERRRDITPREIKNMRIDVWSGMFFSNLIMFFIIVTCAATLAAQGVTNIESADQAAAALRPLAGDFAYLLFAIGIVGTGMLAVPVLAGSLSYALSEALRWKTGLYLKLNQAYAFYGVIIVAMVVGLLLNFIGLDPIKALIWSAIANGIVAPLVLILIVALSSNKKLMKTYVNGPITSSIGWLLVAVMLIAGGAALWSIF